jgi:hypothetical protein
LPDWFVALAQDIRSGKARRPNRANSLGDYRALAKEVIERIVPGHVVELDISCPNAGEHRHSDATPSATWNMESGLWRCHKPCGAQGNARQLLEALGRTPIEAQRLIREYIDGTESVTVTDGDRSVTATEDATTPHGSAVVTEVTDFSGGRADGDVSGVVEGAPDWDTLMELSRDTAELLTFVREYVNRFIFLPSAAQYDAIAVWVLHTWAFEAAELTPYLDVRSPESRAGKSLLLEVMAALVNRPWYTSGGTNSALIRKVSEERATLLYDETDNTMKREKEYVATLLGVLNAGYREGVPSR